MVTQQPLMLEYVLFYIQLISPAHYTYNKRSKMRIFVVGYCHVQIGYCLYPVQGKRGCLASNYYLNIHALILMMTLHLCHNSQSSLCSQVLSLRSMYAYRLIHYHSQPAKLTRLIRSSIHSIRPNLRAYLTAPTVNRCVNMGYSRSYSSIAVM